MSNKNGRDPAIAKAEKALDEQARLDGRSEAQARAEDRLNREADEALYNAEAAEREARLGLYYELMAQYGKGFSAEAPPAPGEWRELEDGSGWWSVDEMGKRMELR